MTPDERTSLQGTGNLISIRLLEVSIIILFFGIFIGLCTLACLSLFKHVSGNSWARRAQLVALLMIFVTSLGSVSAFIANFAIALTHLNSQSAIVNAKSAPFDIALYWAQQISLLLNDAVVIWRAWILYTDKPVVMFSLSLVFCATLATGFAATALISQLTAIENSVSSSGVSASGVSTWKLRMANTLSLAATASSLATNVFATTLILIQLWMHHKFIDGSGLNRHSLTSSQRILLFLVEAGFIFCIGQALDLFINTYANIHVNITFVAYLIMDLLDVIFLASMPLYLPVIILLAENNRTIVETFSFDSKVLAGGDSYGGGDARESGPESSTTDRLSAHESNDNR